MADNATSSSKGLLNSLSVLASSLVSIVHTRLNLLSTGLEEDREHLLSLVMIFFVALFSFVVGVMLVDILLVVIFLGYTSLISTRVTCWILSNSEFSRVWLCAT
jgi:uncharacterized membrane protein YqjE